MGKILVAGFASALMFTSFAVFASCAGDKATANATKAKAGPISQGAKGVEGAAAGSAGAQSGQNINSNAGLSSGAGATCAAGYGDALSKLQALAPKCNVSCTPSDQNDKAQCSDCQKAKTDCQREYTSHMGQNSAGQKGCQQSEDGANKTKDQSQGQPPQMPQMPQGGGDSATPSTPEPAAQTPVAGCVGADSHMNPDCNEKTLSECASASGSDKCESFGFRYCTPASSGGTGEGIGTQVCKERLATKFCNSPGNSACPSCKQILVKNASVCQDPSKPCVGQTEEQQLAEAKASCPTDPLLSDPKVAQSGSSSATAGGSAGGSGASGGGALGSTAPKTVEEDKKTVAGGNTYKNIETGADSGGGGGFSGYGTANSSSDSSDSSSGFQYGSPFGKKPASVGGRGGVAGETSALTAEVNGRYTKSLFTMTSEAIQSRCTRGMLNRCGN